ncbi:MAG: Gfo/Idh/MocA family protein [Thermoplasmata archaeon]
MKVLLLGPKGFGKMHLEAYSKLDVDVEIMERNRETADDLKSKFNIGKIYDNLEESMKSDAEIVDVVLPHNLHHDVVMKALSVGKHVMVEKPIATEISDAREMIEASKRAKRKFMVTDQYFFDPSVKKVKDEIEKGSLGRVHTIIIRDQRLYGWKGWRAEAAAMGGGSLIDGGIHFVDTLLNFGGEYSDVKSLVYKTRNDLQEPDNAEALFKFKNGSNGIFFYSWGYPYPMNLPAFEVIGDRGSAIEDVSKKPDGFNYKEGKRAYGDPVINGVHTDLGTHDIFVDEIGGFIKSVKEDRDVPFSPELALRDLVGVKDIFKNTI